jgi:hypothetical protein
VSPLGDLNADGQIDRRAGEFGQPPPPDCWLHPEVEVGRSPISGRGLFTGAPIRAGTVVSRLGGRVVTTAELRRLFEVAAGDPARPYIDTIAVDTDRHLVLPSGQPNGYGNHSCDPNLWWVGPFELAARRDIAAGEELTNDYATSTFEPDFVLVCSCGSASCRGTVTGDDWRRAELRSRYGEHWVPALLALIHSAGVSVRAGEGMSGSWTPDS